MSMSMSMCMCMCHGCVGARPYVRPLALWLIMLYAAVPPGRYRGRGATPPRLGATCGDEPHTTQQA